MQHPPAKLSIGAAAVSTLALMVLHEWPALPAIAAGAATGVATECGLFALQNAPSHTSDNAANPALMS